MNGREVRSLDDVAEAIKAPIDGFYKVETEEHPREIPLDAGQAKADEPALRDSYGIPELAHLN